jgi:mevalonate kinase
VQANGKILLSGEYFILDGAIGLALPTVRYGQSLRISEGTQNGVLVWNALDENDVLWLSIKIQIADFQILQTNDVAVAQTLVDILAKAKSLNPLFLNTLHAAVIVDTKVNFPRNWGLGTSSTLTHLIAEWAQIDAQQLNDQTFKSSGYDVACAKYASPILYEKDVVTKKITVTENDILLFSFHTFLEKYAQNLYFVHLGQKQNSREGIAFYRKLPIEKRLAVAAEITALTFEIAQSTTLDAFDTALLKHENLVAETLRIPRAKTLYCADFWGEIKSLGAWGGDFVLATSARSAAETHAYFIEKGYTTVLTFNELCR